MENLRRAGVDDVAALTRLRAGMVDAMGVGNGDPSWLLACEAALTRRLAEPDSFAAWVVEVDGRPVSSGVGWIEEHLPWPGRPDGRRGLITSMSTDPQYVRRGYAGQVLGALLGWFDELGIARIDLRATQAGKGLYAKAGFLVLDGTVMSRLRARDRPSVSPR